MAAAINTVNKSVTSYSFIVTLAGNKDHFHRHEIEGADHAHQLYAMIGQPSQQHFKFILNNNLIQNCPMTVDDA